MFGGYTEFNMSLINFGGEHESNIEHVQPCLSVSHNEQFTQ